MNSVYLYIVCLYSILTKNEFYYSILLEVYLELIREQKANLK